jgi:uncharacterized protein (DUF4415 family)
MARKVIADDESPEITAEMFARMRPMKDVTPGMAKAIKALRGRPKVENPKQVVSIRMNAAAVKRWNGLDRKDRAKLVASLEKKIEKRA